MRQWFLSFLPGQKLRFPPLAHFDEAVTDYRLLKGRDGLTRLTFEIDSEESTSILIERDDSIMVVAEDELFGVILTKVNP